MKLMKLIDKPQYTYEGMVYSDGILDHTVRVIPKLSYSNTFSAKCQFKKCLFRVEIFDKCEYHNLYRAQFKVVEEITAKYNQALEGNLQEELSTIFRQMKREEAELARLAEEREREINSNKEV